MDANIISENKDGDSMRPITIEAPSTLDIPNQKLQGPKKKRRRGKSKRKITKPFVKLPWQERRKYDTSKRNYRYRKMVLAKTHAPFNNNQFLMEIHKPEPENNFHNLQTPSARTRDSSFSVDSEDNYFFSLPEDEEEYLTKEFSSVYEDAQSERLSNMSKSELIQEYLLLEAKYDNLVKRNCTRPKVMDINEDKDTSIIDTLVTDKDNMMTEKDTSGTSIESNVSDESSIDILQRVKEQEDQIRELQAANEKLHLDNELLRQRSQNTSSEDSESDSSSSVSNSSSCRTISPTGQLPTVDINGYGSLEEPVVFNGVNGTDEATDPQPLVNGFHEPHDDGIDEDP